jgi:hypothetical protein
MIRLRVLFSLFVVLLFVGCSNDPLKIDVSSVKVKINFVNADSLFVNNSPKKRWDLNREFIESC